MSVDCARELGSEFRFHGRAGIGRPGDAVLFDVVLFEVRDVPEGLGRFGVRNWTRGASDGLSGDLFDFIAGFFLKT